MPPGATHGNANCSSQMSTIQQPDAYNSGPPGQGERSICSFWPWRFAPAEEQSRQTARSSLVRADCCTGFAQEWSIGKRGKRCMTQQRIWLTSAGSSPVRRDYWTCWFTTYTSECALSPLVLPEHPSPLSLRAKPNFYSRFQTRGVLQCLQGKATRTFLLCEKQCIFN